MNWYKKYIFAGEEGPVFYRGTVPGNTQRINEPFEEAKGLTFMARDPASAKMYGSQIEKIQARPGAKILYEGTAEFGKVAKIRGYDPDLYIVHYGPPVKMVNQVLKNAKIAGYDAVSFKSDSDIGTIILNEAAFIRGLT